MYQSKLLQLLRAFKKQSREFQEFEKFIRSPYFNTKQELILLLDFIKPYRQAAEKEQKEKLVKEIAYKKIFPTEEKYKALKMNESLSDLSKLLEKFLVYQQLKKDKRRQDALISEALRDRELDHLFFKKARLLTQKLEKQKKEGLAHNPVLYQDLLYINKAIYFHPKHKNTDKENDLRLAKMLDCLDLEYAIKKLQFACEAYSRSKVFGAYLAPRLLEETRKMVTDNFGEAPLLVAYNNILTLFETGNSEDIPAYKKQLLALVKDGKLDKGIKRDLIYKFINALPEYAGRLELYFELYALLTNSGLLRENGYISSDHFSNIVHLACSLKKEAFLQNFIDQNTKYLQLYKDKTKNIQLLFEAQISFNTEDYNAAFTKLFNLNIEDITYGLRYHCLLMLTILSGHESIQLRYDFEASCRNFKVYVKRKFKRKEISKVLHDGCLIFIKVASKIFKWPYKKGDKQLLLEELAKTSEIPFKHLLAKKVDVLV